MNLDNIQLRPRDDALNCLKKLTIDGPLLMNGPYQELDLARQPRGMLSGETSLDVRCPLRKVKKAAAEAAKGTVTARLYTPAHEIFVQKPFPLVVSEYVAGDNSDSAHESSGVLRAVSHCSDVIRAKEY